MMKSVVFEFKLMFKVMVKVIVIVKYRNMKYMVFYVSYIWICEFDMGILIKNMNYL